jgi:hypothetical protein
MHRPAANVVLVPSYASAEAIGVIRAGGAQYDPFNEVHLRYNLKYKADHRRNVRQVHRVFAPLLRPGG